MPETVGMADGAYETLRHAIVYGHYRPNQRLVEAQLSDDLRVSRTPIREALHRLAQDGLTVKNRHGWSVREFTMAEIGEIYECRAALEAHAAYRVASEQNPDRLETIRRIVVEHSHVDLDSSTARRVVVENNEMFHNAVLQACDNRRLVDMVHRNQSYYFNYEIASLYSAEELRHCIDDHAQIFEAIAAGSAAEASAMMRDHITAAYETFRLRVGGPTVSAFNLSI